MKNSSSNFLLDRSGWHSGSNGDIKKEKNFMTKKLPFKTTEAKRRYQIEILYLRRLLKF